MLILNNKVQCSGCYACAQICPQSCIQMKIDDEGFWYPELDQTRCINCQLCEKACPIYSPLKKITTEKTVAYAAINNNEKIRMQSSSGGIFTALAETIIGKGGVVFGAAFQNDFSVAHICVDRIEDLDKLRGSKYLQSRIGNSFQKTKEFLDCGKFVLFTGTPCQINVLRTI